MKCSLGHTVQNNQARCPIQIVPFNPDDGNMSHAVKQCFGLLSCSVLRRPLASLQRAPPKVAAWDMTTWETRMRLFPPPPPPPGECSRNKSVPWILPAFNSAGLTSGGNVTSGSWDCRLAFSARASSIDSRKLLSATSKAWKGAQKDVSTRMCQNRSSCGQMRRPPGWVWDLVFPHPNPAA